MGMDDFLKKAEEAVGQHPDQAKEGLEKVADFAKSKTDDAGDARVDQALSQAEGFIDKER